MSDQSAETGIPPYARLAVVWAENPASCMTAIARLCPDLHTFMLVSEDPITAAPHGILCETLRPKDITAESLAAFFAKHLTLLYAGRVGCCIDESIQHRFPERTSALMEGLLEATRSAVTQAAFRATKGWHILYGALLNLPRIIGSPTIATLQHRARGLPVVLVGAGPSLDSDAPRLATLRDRCVIIACDAAWNSLARHGIRPDAVMCTDSRDCTWQHLARGSRGQPDVPVIMPVCGSWSVVRHYPGPLCFFRQDWPLDRFIEQACGAPIPVLNPGKCVGNAAFELAVWMGAERIIMTGFTLGYEGDRYHPADRSSAEFHEHPHAKSNLRTITGNDGRSMKTDLSMYFYLRDFEQQIAAVDVPVWNVTTGGARLTGAIRAELQEALDDANAPQAPVIPPLPVSAFQYGDPRCQTAELDVCRAVVAFAREMPRAPMPDVEADFLPRHSLLTGLLETADNPALRAEMRCMLDLWHRDQDLPDLRARAAEAAAHWMDSALSTAVLIPSVLGLRPQNRPADGLWLAVIPAGDRQAADPMLDALQKLRGIRVRFFQGDPQDVDALWKAADDAPGLVIWNGGVLPFIWAFPGLRCIDLASRPPDANVLMEHWLPGYEVFSLKVFAEAWRKKVPDYVPVME